VRAVSSYDAMRTAPVASTAMEVAPPGGRRAWVSSSPVSLYLAQLSADLVGFEKGVVFGLAFSVTREGAPSGDAR